MRAGEILGIAGVDGNGQTELSEAIVGLIPVQSGTIRLAGRDVTTDAVAARYAAGLGFVPEDRLDRGLGATMSVAENVAATHYRRPAWSATASSARPPATALRADRIREFDIRGATPALPVGWLSGGNMQKVVIARELERRPQAAGRGAADARARHRRGRIRARPPPRSGRPGLCDPADLVRTVRDAWRSRTGSASCTAAGCSTSSTATEADEATVGFLMNGGVGAAA